MTDLIKEAAKRKPGRPPLEIDWNLAEKLAQIGCTDEEIASIVGVSYETFMRRKREPVTAERLGRARSMCKASLRRIQWKLAEAGNRDDVRVVGQAAPGPARQVRRRRRRGQQAASVDRLTWRSLIHSMPSPAVMRVSG
jgi:hypothetical protein